MASAEVQRRVDGLGEDLGRSVVVVDPDISLLHSSRHFGDEDPVRVQAVLRRDAGSAAIGHVLAQGVRGWTAMGRIPPAPGIGLRSRLCVPIRWQGTLLGFVMVIDADGSVTAAEERLVCGLAEAVAPALQAEREAGAAADGARARLVTGLVGTDPRERARAVADLARTGAPTAWARATVLDTAVTAPGVDAERREAALRHAVAVDTGARHVLAVVRDGRAVVVRLTHSPLGAAEATAAAEKLLAEIDTFGGGSFRGRAGVGEAVAGAERAWTSARQAELARRAVGALGPGPVAHWRELGAWQVLLRVPPGELDETAVPPELRALEAADRRGVLVPTLEAYLRHAGLAVPAAAALHVHRTSLYYRLDRIRALTGLDIDDGATRLRLQLGLAARRLLDFRQRAFLQGEESQDGGSSAGSW